MRLSALRLRVADPDRLAAFYRDILGMSGWPNRNRRTTVSVMTVQDADLLLLPGGGGYTHDKGQRYWKIGITVPDVDLAAAHLRRFNVPVSDAEPVPGYRLHVPSERSRRVCHRAAAT